MAKVYVKGDPLLIGHYSARNQLLQGCRRSGRVILRHKSGSYRIEGLVQLGLTVEQLRVILEKRRGKFEEVRVFDDLGGAPIRSLPTLRDLASVTIDEPPHA